MPSEKILFQMHCPFHRRSIGPLPYCYFYGTIFDSNTDLSPPRLDLTHCEQHSPAPGETGLSLGRRVARLGIPSAALKTALPLRPWRERRPARRKRNLATETVSN